MDTAGESITFTTNFVMVSGRPLNFDNGTFETPEASSGTWAIVVELDGVDGAINFRVEKP